MYSNIIHSKVYLVEIVFTTYNSSVSSSKLGVKFGEFNIELKKQ